jgi:hypothetical protein
MLAARDDQAGQQACPHQALEQSLEANHWPDEPVLRQAETDPVSNAMTLSKVCRSDLDTSSPIQKCVTQPRVSLQIGPLRDAGIEGDESHHRRGR